MKADPIAAVSTPHCPVSRSSDVVRLGEVDGFTVWRCPDSATDFVWPVPSDAELKRYYDRVEWFEGGEVGGYADYDRQTNFSLPTVAGLLDRFPADGSAHYVLDVGCGYGTHLALAAERGWKCFGVELSDHARATAIERHGSTMVVVEQVEELIPHVFDLVLMLDVIEHVGDPYALMFRLFNRGLIGPKTRVVISTPNARSADAVRDGDRWIYRHPPSHLVYYSARSLQRLMRALQFDDIRCHGTSEVATEDATYADEDLAPDESLTRFAGLVCEAEGSRFFAFMQERYVPGTWSKLAEYEHVPRYQFARRFAGDAKVLDFGCGTGYGARYLADTASDVLGLDIDADALDWARFWHEPSRLRFERHADLGATLPASTFDLVTCFEMIEHVDHAMQKATIESLARVVKPGGKLLISTPNPAVTANYGANPYHLREMTEPDFVELLAPHFEHVAIYRQWVRPSVLIGSEPIPSGRTLLSHRLGSEAMVDEPPAFIAVCSHRPLEPVDPFCTFDGSFDMVLAETQAQKTLTGLRFDNYLLREARDQAERRERLAGDEARQRDEADEARDEALAQQGKTIASMHAAFDEQARHIDGLRGEIGKQDEALGAQAATIAGMRESFALQQANIDALKAELEAKETAFAAQADTIAGMHESFAAQRANIDALTAELEARETAFAVQAGTIAGMHESFVAQQAHIDALMAELEARETAFAVQADTIAGMHESFAAQQANIDALKAELEAKETAFTAQAETIAGMHAGFTAQQTHIDTLMAELEARDTAFAAQADTIAGMRESFAVQQANIDALQEELETREASFTAQADTIAGMRKSFVTQQANIDALKAELEAKKTAFTTQAGTIAGMREGFAAQRTSIDALKVDLDARETALAVQARTIRGMHDNFAAQRANIEALKVELAARDAALVEHEASIAGLGSTVERQSAALDQQRVALVEVGQNVALQEQRIATMRGESAAQEIAIRALRDELVAKVAAIAGRERELDDRTRALADANAALADRDATVERQQAHARRLESLVGQRTAEKEEWQRHYAALENTRFVRLARLLHGNSGSRAPLVEVTYLVAGGLIPGSVKTRLAPLALTLRGRFAKPSLETGVFAPYTVKPPARVRASRPRVLHVIANFMTGGSSRLVVDLLEHLGGEYDQHVLTSFIPSPVNYIGVDITEVRDLADTAAIRDVLASFDPHIVHVHYWGDCDEPWYRAVFAATAERACPIVQNINTPVAPFADVTLARNVFVSRYVLDHFGDGHATNMVIYPGSDFTLFAPARRPRAAHGCIGMVYRLERDKLDEFAIEPFIEAARTMPGLRCLIVGGGSLLQPFKDRVHAEGLDDAFDFTGYVSYEALPALYKRMDVFVAPIWKESFGQVSAFAMNMGIPVIGYDVGAIPEIVADPSLVAPSRDAQALANIAVGLVQDDQARASIGVANRKRAARMFSVQAMIKSYRNLYRELLKQ